MRTAIEAFPLAWPAGLRRCAQMTRINAAEVESLAKMTVTGGRRVEG